MFMNVNISNDKLRLTSGKSVLRPCGDPLLKITQVYTYTKHFTPGTICDLNIQ